MELFAGVAAWLADPTHWQGPDGIPTRIAEHLQISALSVLIAALVALPVGFFIGHTGRGATLAVGIANIGRAVPSYAILVMLFPISLAVGLDLSFWPTFAAMTLLAIPPILTNTYVGLHELDRDLLEGARAMGMRGSQVLMGVEIPLALPVILAGIRTAAVQVVATATLGALIGLGGLGRYIVDGIARNENDRLFSGALLVALLAIATELALSWLARRVVSPGLADVTARPFVRQGRGRSPGEKLAEGGA